MTKKLSSLANEGSLSENLDKRSSAMIEETLKEAVASLEKDAAFIVQSAEEKVETVTAVAKEEIRKDAMVRVDELVLEKHLPLQESMDGLYRRIEEVDDEIVASLSLSEKQYKELRSLIDGLKNEIGISFKSFSKADSKLDSELRSMPEIVEKKVLELRKHVSGELKKINDLNISKEFRSVFKKVAEIEKYAKSIPWGGASYPQLVNNNGKAVYQGAVINFKNGNNTTAVVSQNDLTGNVDVTFNSTASSGNNVYGEVPSGSGTGFTLAHTPVAGSVRLYRGGAYQQAGAGKDYVISGANITLAITLAAGEVLLADYSY